MIGKSEILEFLRKDEINNINMINFIESYPISEALKVGESMLVKGTSDRHWIYISSKSKEELKILKDKLNASDKNFAIIEDWMLPTLTEGNKIKWKLSTMRLILPYKTLITEPKENASPLTTKDAKFIYDNAEYKEFLSIEYIKERIENGISSCIRYENTPIAWGITQDDGALGFLHVLPEQRRRGLAKEVTKDLINKIRSYGKIPFVHIEEKNEKSMNLALSLGFKKDKTVNWFELE